MQVHGNDLYIRGNYRVHKTVQENNLDLFERVWELGVKYSFAVDDDHIYGIAGADRKIYRHKHNADRKLLMVLFLHLMKHLTFSKVHLTTSNGHKWI